MMKRAERQMRANGEESRERILDAAAQIAGERGYEGTSIGLVSERSGLPASSIYWHFQDKDRLIAAVIERSFNRWLEGMDAWVPPKSRSTRLELLVKSMRRTARALADVPEFLRLGLMLALERRPREATARKLFLQVREQAFKRIAASYQEFFGPELERAGAGALARLVMAAADGLFIAREIDCDEEGFRASFELLASAILGAADQLLSRSERSSPGNRNQS